ncbi:MAG: nicotinamide-nucleotide adenylyltransferase [Thermoplasmata archaeon]|nr:nicotinamide-nucleotide adenylyltransferase [Thermoplasmata archaeon]
MTGLIVGRFQPFHRGHLSVVSDLRRAQPEGSLILAVGSAQESFTAENPFTAGERVEMIQRALAEGRVNGCLPVPVADIHRHAQWVAYLRGLLPAFDVVYTNNPLTRLLFERERIRVESPPFVDRKRFQGEVVRRRLLENRGWEELVPPAVARFLVELGAPERLRRIAERVKGPSAESAP